MVRRQQLALHGQRAADQQLGCGMVALLGQHLTQCSQRKSGLDVLGSGAAFVAVEHASEQHFGLVQPAKLHQRLGQVVQCAQRQRMLRAQCAFADRQRSLQVGLGRRQVAVPVVATDGRMCERGVYMVRRQRLFLDGQCALQQRRHHVGMALHQRHARLLVQRQGRLGMLVAEGPFADLHQLLDQR